MSETVKKSTVRDMTQGSIVKQAILFSLPLMLGNVFQMLYNTVDSIVVGNYVGTQALAAVGSTTLLVNMLVFFFNGFSIGAGVVISRNFGARDMKKLHAAIQTTMAATFVLCAIFTVGGVLAVKPALRMMSTPEDVFGEATTYLQIYIGGISGLLIYNMGSGILRAVGDTTRPLYFLILTSVLNILLDLLFVIVFHWGIAGVALATILSQFISAGLTLLLLTRTRDIYRMTWNDLKMDFELLGQIISVGLPTAIQTTITGFSNIFVQSYINSFGSACMAGWSSYNKLDSFIFLPVLSLSAAATTFVSQNMGAGQKERANRGTLTILGLMLSVTVPVSLMLFVLAEPAVKLFTNDPEVVAFGAMFLHVNVLMMLFNGISHTMAGSLRGYGDSRAPMVFLLLNFVGVRQAYLYIVTHYIAHSAMLVGFGYPVGWMSCAVMESVYFFLKYRIRREQAA